MNYDNSLKGVLFKNDNKREGKKDADYRGQCELNGQAFWIDAWINKSKEGRSYMALKFKAKDAKSEEPRRQPAEKPAFNDDIPFAFVIALPFLGLLVGSMVA